MSAVSISMAWLAAGPAPDRRRAPRRPRAILKAVQAPVSLWAVACYSCARLGPVVTSRARAIVPAKGSGFRWTEVGGLGGWLCQGCRVELDALLRPPPTRADCVGGARPCLRTRCRWNLLGDVSRKAGDFEVPQTCALDVADQGAHTYEQIGSILGLTREGARGVAEGAFAKLRETAAFDFDMDDDDREDAT